MTGVPSTLPALITTTEGFISANPEVGRRGQAFGAAALDLAFDEVETRRINDPSRHGPGDVRVLADGQLRMPVEVKQKIVTDTDVLLFAQAVAEWQLVGGVYFALDPRQPPLDSIAVNSVAVERYGVGVNILIGVAEVFTAIATWGQLTVETVLRDFPSRMLARMEEIEVGVDGLTEWATLFQRS